MHRESILLLTFSVLVYLSVASARQNFLNPFPQQVLEYSSDDVGEPLVLTPLLEKNQTAEARAKAAVKLTGKAAKVESYSGYFTVNKEYNSNLFFWYFPSRNDYKNDPVILWLQGGPGSPSMYGLLMEHGPIIVNNNVELDLREHSWNNNHSVIYIDNPVGTGFSFTENDKGYARDQNQVARELENALQQFFKVFPELRKNEFFITGESYGGKYVPALAYYIHKQSYSPSSNINLKGIAIGNAYIDPFYQTGYAEYTYELSLIDEATRNTINQLEIKSHQYISEGKYYESHAAWEQILHTILDVSGSVNIYNYLQIREGVDTDAMDKYLSKAETRRAIHVGNTTFGDTNVYDYLTEDMQKTVRPWFIEIVNNYRVMLYSGQLDIIVAYPLTANFLHNIEFKGCDIYRNATRKIWHVGQDVAGYSKTAGNFTEVLVRDAGHMVPLDQPKWAEDLIYKFVRNQPL